MNKKFGVFVFGLILTLSVVSLVSAASPIVDMINSVKDGAWDVLKPVLDILVGDTTAAASSDFSSSDIFLIKLMFLVIIFSVSWKVLDIMPVLNEKSWVPIVIGIAVSILSVRFVNDSSTIAAMLFPYGVFGVALTSFLPFVIYFFATVKMTPTLTRKLAWMFFGVVYLFMYINRINELGEYALMYLIVAILSVVIILGDSVIQRARAKNQIDNIHSVHNKKRALDLHEERDRLSKAYHSQLKDYNGIYSSHKGAKGYHEDIEQIDTMIANLSSGLIPKKD